jgi:hypothetical protein
MTKYKFTNTNIKYEFTNIIAKLEDGLFYKEPQGLINRLHKTGGNYRIEYWDPGLCIWQDCPSLKIGGSFVSDPSRPLPKNDETPNREILIKAVKAVLFPLNGASYIPFLVTMTDEGIEKFVDDFLAKEIKGD